MPRKNKEVSVEAVKVPTHKENLEARQTELAALRETMLTNRFLNVGEVERELARVTLELSQL